MAVRDVIRLGLMLGSWVGGLLVGLAVLSVMTGSTLAPWWIAATVVLAVGLGVVFWRTRERR